MRIVAGRFKGRHISTPDGQKTRPTSDRAREAIFNILAHADWVPNLDGARVLDIFAGSGALGLEALSRGAAFCLFVETDETARGAIRENVETFALFGTTRVHRRDATKLGLRTGAMGAPYDLVFLDPPYHKGLGEQALKSLIDGDWLSEKAIVVFERASDEDDFISGDWHKISSKIYGAAQVLFLERKI
ncbi:MAG: 16S rRNA (guanine(966)-N(2))-methyltransferase RsmD [Asticcacaulis sp.]